VLLLSTGLVLEVRWDVTYQHRDLILFQSIDSEHGEHVTGEMTGLADEVLRPLVEEVEEAVSKWDDDSSWEEPTLRQTMGWTR
jgi:hypothetical protein